MKAGGLGVRICRNGADKDRLADKGCGIAGCHRAIVSVAIPTLSWHGVVEAEVVQRWDPVVVHDGWLRRKRERLAAPSRRYREADIADSCGGLNRRREGIVAVLAVPG